MNAGLLARSQLAVAVAVTLALAPTDARWAALSKALLALVHTLAWPMRVNAVRTGETHAVTFVSRALDAVDALAIARMNEASSKNRATRVRDRVRDARVALAALSESHGQRAA